MSIFLPGFYYYGSYIYCKLQCVTPKFPTFFKKPFGKVRHFGNIYPTGTIFGQWDTLGSWSMTHGLYIHGPNI